MASYRSSAPCPLPPAPDDRVGWRVLQTLVRERSMLAALAAMHEQLGDVFRITLPGFEPVVVAGPKASRAVLVTQRDQFRWRNPRDPVTRLLRHGLLVEDGAGHDLLRSRLDPLLQRPAALAHAEAMWRATATTTASWQEDTRDMLVEMRRVTLIILMETLFGIDVRPDLGRLWPSILRLIDYISPGWWILWPNAPRLGYGRAMREMDGYLYGLIRARRAAGPAKDDLLTRLIEMPGLSDDAVRDQLLTLIIAGHDTTTALLAWTLYLLGRQPEVMARAQAEVDAVLDDGPLTAEQLRGLHYLDLITKESLRLYPPIHVGNRLAADDLSLEGYHVPAGTRVMVSMYLSHRDPSYWVDPHCFRPERFDSRPPAFTYLPFGGGPRNCVGAAFAQVEAKIVLAYLLRAFDWQLLTPAVRPQMGATLNPHPGVLMRIVRRRRMHE